MTSRAALWTFAKSFYARPGVSDMLLRLQDDHDADIPLLLVVLYAARLRRVLDPTAIRDLARQAGTWRRDVVAPIRTARRALKDCPLDRDSRLYEQAKALEIGAERAVICELGAMLPAGRQASIDIAALANLEGYRHLLDLAEDLFAPILKEFSSYEAEVSQ